jgi:PadR family transcriptional regulator PadR
MVKKSAPYEPRITHQTLVVLNEFLIDPTRELSGSDLLDRVRVASGTLYPILMRLEEAKWLRSHQEDVDPSDVGRPRRRLYRITSTGLARTRSLRSEILGGLPA